MTFVSVQILVTQLQNKETGVMVEGTRELASPLKGDSRIHRVIERITIN